MNRVDDRSGAWFDEVVRHLERIETKVDDEADLLAIDAAVDVCATTVREGCGRLREVLRSGLERNAEAVTLLRRELQEFQTETREMVAEFGTALSASSNPRRR